MTPKVVQEIGKFTSVGSYTILYTEAKTGDVFCFDCALEESQLNEKNSLTASVFWEGNPECCDGCGLEIEPSYGGHTDGGV